MTTVLALDEGLAAEIRELLPGRVIEHHGADLTGVDPSEWAVEGPAQLVELCEREQANVLVLGVRLGGQRYLAMDIAAVLLRGAERTERPPAVVILSPSMTPAIHRSAWSLGCYQVVAINVVRRGGLARAVADCAVAASAWRRGRSVARALQPPEQVEPSRQRARKRPAKP